MSKVIRDQSTEPTYNYRNFNILCDKCDVSEKHRAEILEFFLYCRLPTDDILLKHFAALKVFYTNLFLTKDVYNGKTDVVRAVFNNCKIKGLRTIIDPSCHIRSRAEKFIQKYKNNRTVLIDQKITNKPDMANMVRVDEYGLKFFCQRGIYILQYAKATEFKYSTKANIHNFPDSAAGPSKPSAKVYGKHEELQQQDNPPRDEMAAVAKKTENRMLDFPIQALKDCIDVLARQGFTSSARTIKILVNNYNVVITELQFVKNKREWLDEHYYIYTLLENSAMVIYKQLENDSNTCTDSARRREALKSLSACKPAFINIWNACLRALAQNGIRILPIKWHSAEYTVSKNQLQEGWELRNDENRKANIDNPVNKVYGIIQNGILVDNQIVKKPIVNVYTD